MDEMLRPHPNAERAAPARTCYWFGWSGPGAHWVWVSIGLYVVACFLPAMPPIFGTNKIYGWNCLLMFVYFIPAWWANPVYFLALILTWRRCQRAAAICACLAVVLAVSIQVMGFPNPGWTDGITDSEPGCYVWIISMQLLALNLLWLEWRAWKRRQELERL